MYSLPEDEESKREENEERDYDPYDAGTGRSPNDKKRDREAPAGNDASTSSPPAKAAANSKQSASL